MAVQYRYNRREPVYDPLERDEWRFATGTTDTEMLTEADHHLLETSGGLVAYQGGVEAMAPGGGSPMPFLTGWMGPEMSLATAGFQAPLDNFP